LLDAINGIPGNKNKSDDPMRKTKNKEIRRHAREVAGVCNVDGGSHYKAWGHGPERGGKRRCPIAA
jgi:hypothetical protein